MNDTVLHIIVIAATFFLAGAVAILLAGLNPAWKETVRGLWSAYRLEFAIVGAILVPAAIGGWLFVAVLLLIATLSMPAVIRHLAARQFASLEMRRGGTWYGSLIHALWTTLICLVLLVVTLPLWLVPPFFALIPPLLWGWLTYRVMTYDALALHATSEERRALVRRHRLPLLLIGVASGLLGSLPTLLWASSVWLIVLFPVVTAATIWIYAFILVFSALWFGYYCLRALQRMRAEEHGTRTAVTVPY